MLPFGVTIPVTVPQRAEIQEGLMNNPVYLNTFAMHGPMNVKQILVDKCIAHLLDKYETDKTLGTCNIKTATRDSNTKLF
jgi:hypothetical protein